MERKTVRVLKASSPRGRIYVGDPCYVMDRDHYDSLLEALHSSKESSCEVELLKGVFACVGRTKFGDGFYETGSVDSGLIGAIPIELCDKNKIRPKSTGFVIPVEYMIWSANKVDLSYTESNGHFLFKSERNVLTVMTDSNFEDNDDNYQDPFADYRFDNDKDY